jgi:hypothetical protein
MASYRYSISTDFPNHVVATSRLQEEIRASTIVTAQDYINTEDDVCEIWFKADLSPADLLTLNGLVAVHSGEPLVPAPEFKLDSDGRQVMVVEPQLDGAMLNIVSYNFCDKSSWWQQSTAVANEVLVDSGDGLVWTSAHPFWTDLTHGKFYLEDRVTNRSSYVPVIKVDGTALTERTPFTTSGGDYVVDYRAGTVTFATSQAGKVVTAGYRYASSSLFTISPSSGKVLWVQDSEIQFSTDVVMTGTMNFQAWAYNPNDLPNKMPVTAVTNYKNMRDFIDEARGMYPVIPAIGGAVRGLLNPHVVLPFRYSQAKELRSSLGVEIRVWISGDAEYVGEFGTATFYCTSYAET